MRSTTDLTRLTEMTLGETLANAARLFPDRVALLWEDASLTYAEWDVRANQLARLLVELGVGEGARIALWMDKRIDVPVAFLGIARARAVSVPVNFKLPARAQRYQVEAFGVEAIITQRSHLKEVEAVADALPGPSRIIVVDGDADDAPHTPAAAAAALPSTPPDRHPRADDVVYLNMTSGTTGRPKAGITTHAMIQWNTRSSIESLAFGDDERFLCMFSVFAHPHELFCRPLAVGGCAVLVDSLNVRAVARAIEAYRVTWVMAVPSFYEMLSEHAEGSGADLSCLRMLEAGGAHLPPEAYARLAATLAAPLVPVWGSTETSGVAVTQRRGAECTPGSMGYVAEHYEVKVIRDDGQPAGPGEIGEMYVRGRAVVAGYWGDDEETGKHFGGGWYRTDDLVKQGEDGELRFCARRSEMMKIGGIRVFPLEIELALRKHPAVADAVVVRAEETLRGEIARAVIIPRAGAEISIRALRLHCRQHLALYQVPRMIELWDEIPRTPAGKVDKAAIMATPPVN